MRSGWVVRGGGVSSGEVRLTGCGEGAGCEVAGQDAEETLDGLELG